MPRQPRPDLAGIAQHVVQRGIDRQACFFSVEDYRCYLTGLRQAASRYACHVHAYVLMTNHVHLLVTPEKVGAVSRMMQWLGRHYVGYVNARYRRTGTLWEGRFKSCLVDSERYLLTCYRYIELNPVRAGMVEQPHDYRWSSYHANALGEPHPMLVPHASYLELGVDAVSRQQAYRDLFREGLDEAQLAEIRAYVQQQRALGGPRFQSQIEAMLGRCARVRPAHRPVSSKDGTHKGL
jgi:putative transposase